MLWLITSIKLAFDKLNDRLCCQDKEFIPTGKQNITHNLKELCTGNVSFNRKAALM